MDIPGVVALEDPDRDTFIRVESRDALCGRLHGDFLAARGIRQRYGLRRVVAHDGFAEPEPPPAEDAGVADVPVDDRQPPHAAHALVG